MTQKNQEYKGTMKWVIYGMCVASLLFISGATYAIVRIIDGNWTDWKFPAILGIICFVLVTVSAMFTSLGDVKMGIDLEIQKTREKQKGK